MSADGAASMLAAAVQAAIHAKAPRRTVAAVAAAVAGALRPPIASATPAAGGVESVRDGKDESSVRNDESNPAALLEALRASRRAQRKHKKDRRRAAKLAAASRSADNPDAGPGDSQGGEVVVMTPSAEVKSDAVHSPSHVQHAVASDIVMAQDIPAGDEDADIAALSEYCSNGSIPSTLRAPSSIGVLAHADLDPLPSPAVKGAANDPKKGKGFQQGKGGGRR